MALQLAFLPAAVAAAIQDGVLERKFHDSLFPLLKWRGVADQERHAGRMGEKVTKTRPGLITPGTAASTLITPGQDPPIATRSIEQFGYQIASYGTSLVTDLPASVEAAASLFADDVGALGKHAAQTLGRIARDKLIAAYKWGNTHTTAAQGNPGSTTVAVEDVAGFESVLVNGVFVPVSVSNPLPITIGGNPANVTAVDTVAKELTIAVAATWSQYDAVLAVDRAVMVRENSRATDRLIVAGDTATIATFRAAKARLIKDNVPGIGGAIENDLHVCFISPDVANALFADDEFHDAIQAQGLSGPFASGAIGDYAGIRFVPNNEFTKLSGGTLQTTIHQSLMVGAGALVEAYLPEEEFAREVTMGGVALANHWKGPMDPAGVISMVVRAPLDALGRRVTSSWAANVDWTVPTDALALSGAARYKRAVLIHTAGPA